MTYCWGKKKKKAVFQGWGLILDILPGNFALKIKDKLNSKYHFHNLVACKAQTFYFDNI